MQSDQFASGQDPDKSAGSRPDMRADIAHTSSQLKEGVNQEMAEARATLHDARDAAYRKAGDLASEAKAAASEKAEAAQHSLAGSLTSFGDALRAAGDQLQQKEQGQAAKLVNGAAGGIESLAGSLKDKPFQEVVNDIRAFGRSNPTALIAGSVLAGLALSRFLKSSSPSGSASSRPARPSALDRRDRGDFSRPSAPAGSGTYSGSQDQAMADPLVGADAFDPLPPRSPGAATTSSGLGG